MKFQILLTLASTVAAASRSHYLRSNLTNSCDCSWTHGGTTCGSNDGSTCWQVCCGSGGGGSGGGSTSGTASTTRYWDCSKPTCAWAGKCPGAGVAPDYAASWNQLFKINGQIYGTVATSGSLGQDNNGDDCNKCYKLTVQDGPAAGKNLIVMSTNFCPDQPTCPSSPSSTNQYGEHYHFDIAIPGGGVGYADHCQQQYGDSYDWKSYSRNDCSKLPSALQSGCYVWYDDLNGMDNPKVAWEVVSCPGVFHC